MGPLDLKTAKEVRNRGSGFLLLLLILLILYSLRPAFNRPEPRILSCEEDFFVQVEGEIKYPGVYPFCLQPNLLELVDRGGGTSHNIDVPKRFSRVILPFETRVCVEMDQDGWTIEQGEMSAFYRLTLGLPIFLNRESEEGLTAIPGIGPGLARLIVRERAKRGGFKELEEIISIDGIGDKIFNKIVQYVIL
ncbi:MAG: helix-hairpin-helix domain-containing protein [Deltaproteobacteria bacterium]|nr:helix-hairpin-helix domain-containing protein [Deltaproteobacteria bacterium]